MDRDLAENTEKAMEKFRSIDNGTYNFSNMHSLQVKKKNITSFTQDILRRKYLKSHQSPPNFNYTKPNNNQLFSNINLNRKFNKPEDYFSNSSNKSPSNILKEHNIYSELVSLRKLHRLKYNNVNFHIKENILNQNSNEISNMNVPFDADNLKVDIGKYFKINETLLNSGKREKMRATSFKSNKNVNNKNRIKSNKIKGFKKRKIIKLKEIKMKKIVNKIKKKS